MNMLIGKWHKMTHFLSIFRKIENKKLFALLPLRMYQSWSWWRDSPASLLKVFPITNTWSQWKEIEHWDWIIEIKFVQDRYRVFKSYWDTLYKTTDTDSPKKLTIEMWATLTFSSSWIHSWNLHRQWMSLWLIERHDPHIRTCNHAEWMNTIWSVMMPLRVHSSLAPLS